MKQLKRYTALLLSLLVLFPTQALMVVAETSPSEQMEEDAYAIYWNPGGQLPAEPAVPSNVTATLSNATVSNATVSNAVPFRAKTGKDTANGLSPEQPVKTLAKAMERAEELMEKEGLDSADITKNPYLHSVANNPYFKP